VWKPEAAWTRWQAERKVASAENRTPTIPELRIPSKNEVSLYALRVITRLQNFTHG